MSWLSSFKWICAGSHSNGSPKQKNLPGDSIRIFDLHAQGNEEANQGGEVDKYSAGAPHEASKTSDENDKEENYVDKPNLHDSAFHLIISNKCTVIV